MKRTLLLLVLTLVPLAAVGGAQNRMTYSVASTDSGHLALGLAIRKLNVAATFMQAPAHPDDETNALFALFGLGMGMRTVDVQNNRGEGGQNEIGPELFRDIGVLRIVGFARWQVLAVFLAESLLIAIAGGALGCALASLADGWTANSIISGGQGAGGKFVALRLVVSIDTLATGMVVAMFMGVIGGFLPAFSAMRQRPLEALR